MPPKRKRDDKATKGAKKQKDVKDDEKQQETETDQQTKDNTTSKPSFSCWLVKSEPESRIEEGVDMKFSFDDLKASPDQTSCWDGVRNYLARNYLRDQLKLGHDVFFYHSNCKVPGIAGICKVVKEGYPDHTQFDSKDPHFDRTSKKSNPRWFMVDVKYVRPLKRFIPLAEMKKIHQQHSAKGGPLKNVSLFTKARLSVQPLTQEEWDFILTLENE